MNKQALKTQLINKVQVEITELEKICESAHKLVTGGDLKSDGKYDTRATEAGYLAGAQKKRLEELKIDLTMLNEVPVKPFQKGRDISIGDLVEIEHNGHVRKYYITPTPGGSQIMLEGEAVMVISVFSPLGGEALGLGVGDEFEVDMNGKTRVYKINQAY